MSGNYLFPFQSGGKNGAACLGDWALREIKQKNNRAGGSEGFERKLVQRKEEKKRCLRSLRKEGGAKEGTQLQRKEKITLPGKSQLKKKNE